ncbi:CRE-PRMT-6 protein [Aphelenchoides avenae]|nr:CRE-PRMT-6 protein [Aphelenchus avenae]
MNFKAEFDVAMAIFVLQFAEDATELKKILKNIAKALKSGGVLYGYVPNGVRNINPTIKEGKILGATLVLPNRPPKDGQQAKMRLYGAESMHEAPITFFYRETYERLLKLAGFVRIEWIPPRVPKEAEEEYGKDVLKSFLNPPKDIMFRAVKTTKHERAP